MLKIEERVNLAKYSTLGVGGQADYLLVATNKADLLAGLDWAHSQKLPFIVLGGGSNVLISDEGFRGFVIINHATECKIVNSMVTVDSGANFGMIARETLDKGLAGLHFGAGIPGTIGGAVVGNAGAIGWDIAKTLRSAQVWDNGNVEVYTNADFNFGYRASKLKGRSDLVVISAEFELKFDDKNELSKLVRDDHKRRAKSYLGRTCGSYFKNHECGGTAGELIDRLGLKGYRIGGAEISPLHANVIRNVDHATASDILAIEKLVVRKVKEKYGIDLTPEVVKIGNFRA
jgi:UDP-N-acetylmuramate dehydrogenase